LVSPGVPGDEERLAGVPPLDKGVVVIGGDIEGSGASEGEAVPIAEDGAASRAVVAGFAGVTGGVAGVALRAGLCRDDGELPWAFATTEVLITIAASVRTIRIGASCCPAE
jgi:hypothetical protein